MIVHECAPRFNKEILTRNLKGYTLHQVYEPDVVRGRSSQTNKPMHLSQHCFGWPEHRPRAYSVLTRDSTCTLDGLGLDLMHALFRKPVIPVSSLWCAPEAGFLLMCLVLCHMICHYVNNRETVTVTQCYYPSLTLSL